MSDLLVDKYYIRDSEDGMVHLSRQPFENLDGEPTQLVVISGLKQIALAKTVMSRREFAEWRNEVKEQGLDLELKFE